MAAADWAGDFVFLRVIRACSSALAARNRGTYLPEGVLRTVAWVSVRQVGRLDGSSLATPLTSQTHITANATIPTKSTDRRRLAERRAPNRSARTMAASPKAAMHSTVKGTEAAGACRAATPILILLKS